MRLRVWLLTLVVILANVGGNAILGYAMKQAPATAGVIGSILQPVAMLGIAVLIAWMLLRMRLLGLADLSFVVPVTAVGYVLSALAGVILLHEHVPLRGWIGTVIIMAGATLTGLTEHSPQQGNGFHPAPTRPGPVPSGEDRSQ
jgi:drug/metabolite transporter (DMT)-like permease